MKYFILILGVFALIASGVWAIARFPEKHPDKTLAIAERVSYFLEKITLPIKLAKLATLEPDAQILMPVHGARVSQVADTWGASRGEDRVHEGQDIFATRGTPIFSATNGYVVRINTEGLGGNSVYVVGTGGRRYYYAHLDRFAEGLYTGQEVTTDTVIGFVGNTGNAETTPPHLHLGIYFMRDAINPLPLLRDRTPKETLTIGDITLHITRAETPESITRGLSGKKSLLPNEGMLFVFSEPTIPRFWMKDMRFAIDIIWLDENFAIVGGEKNVSPDTYPQTFSPPVPIRYVLETNPGLISF